MDSINKTKIEKVLLYYGYPVAIGGTYSVSGAVNIYKNYDIVILGDTYQSPSHEVYDDTVAIIKELSEKYSETRIVGYVPIGLHPDWAESNLDMDELKRRVDNINIHISTCTCSSRRESWAEDLNPIKLPPERNSTDLAMSVNVFVVNLDTRTINVIKVGSKRDNEVKTSSDLVFTY